MPDAPQQGVGIAHIKPLPPHRNPCEPVDQGTSIEQGLRSLWLLVNSLWSCDKHLQSQHTFTTLCLERLPVLYSTRQRLTSRDVSIFKTCYASLCWMDLPSPLSRPLAKGAHLEAQTRVFKRDRVKLQVDPPVVNIVAALDDKESGVCPWVISHKPVGGGYGLLPGDRLVAPGRLQSCCHCRHCGHGRAVRHMCSVRALLRSGQHKVCSGCSEVGRCSCM